MEISHFIFTFQIRNEIASLILFVWDCYAYSFVRFSAYPRALSRNRTTKIYIYFVFAKLFQEKIKKEPARVASALVVWLGCQLVEIYRHFARVVLVGELRHACQLQQFDIVAVIL